LKKFAFIGVAAGLGVGALLVLHGPTHAADHLDAPAVVTNPMADLTDVYAWMDSSGTKVNLILNVSPGDPGGSGAGSAARHFGPSILYVFHVTSQAMFAPPGTVTGTTTNVICKFASDTSAECWVGTKDYVKGDPSATGGVSSTDGKVKLFAGRRSDPFFFNFNGFLDAIGYVDGLEGSGGSNLDSLKGSDGCLGTSATGMSLELALLEPAAGSARGYLQEGAQTGSGHFPCNGAAAASADCFIGFDVQSIVLQVDKELLNANTNTVLGVWASTNAAN
jgi:hypothetical protein